MPVPDYSDPTPAYMQIAANLREGIRAGKYEPGSRLPSNKELSKLYSVADGTLRQALEVLQSEGIVATQSTRGTFVTNKPSQEMRPDLSAVGQQLADLAQRVQGYDELKAEVAALRQRVGELETALMDFVDSSATDFPNGGEHEQRTEQPPRRKQSSR